MTMDNTRNRGDESATESTGPTRQEWADADPCMAVVEAIADTTDESVGDTSPLYNYVDPDALRAIMSPQSSGSTDSTTISFMYDGLKVRVDSSGWIQVWSDGVDGG